MQISRDLESTEMYKKARKLLLLFWVFFLPLFFPMYYKFLKCHHTLLLLYNYAVGPFFHVVKLLLNTLKKERAIKFRGS